MAHPGSFDYNMLVWWNLVKKRKNHSGMDDHKKSEEI
jgi:hypothetical protein